MINMQLYQILAFTIHGKISKKSYRNNKFKISTPTWNDKFELLGGSYSASDTQDHFEYIIKKHETVTDKPRIRICENKIENEITFEIKTGYYLEFLTPEKMILLGSTENKITKDKNDENFLIQKLLKQYFNGPLNFC